jgi:hypothetical protein
VVEGRWCAGSSRRCSGIGTVECGPASGGLIGRAVRGAGLDLPSARLGCAAAGRLPGPGWASWSTRRQTRAPGWSVSRDQPARLPDHPRGDADPAGIGRGVRDGRPGSPTGRARPDRGQGRGAANPCRLRLTEAGPRSRAASRPRPGAGSRCVSNTAVLTGPDGYRGKYQKVQSAFRSRSSGVGEMTGRSWKRHSGTSACSCYNAWPESCRELRLRGADILVTPTAWGYGNESHPDPETNVNCKHCRL